MRGLGIPSGLELGDYQKISDDFANLTYLDISTL